MLSALGSLGFRKLHPVRNHDLLGNLFIDRSDVVVAITVVKGANYGGMSADNWAHDAAFCATVRTDCADLHQHAVAMHSRANRVGRNEDVARETGLEAFIQ